MRALILAALVTVALPAFAQSLMVSPDIQDLAIAHVSRHGTTHGLDASDVSDLVVSSAHTNQRTGLSYVYVQQRIGGIDVAEAIVSVAVNRDRRVIHAAGDLVSGTLSAPRGPGLSAEDAVVRASVLVGVATPSTANARRVAGTSQKAVFPAIRTVPVTARLIYQTTANDGLRLAWEVILPTEDGHHVWQVRVDAQSGAELNRHDQVVSETFSPVDSGNREIRESFAPVLAPSASSRSPFLDAASGGALSSYKVYPFPVEAPLWTAPAPPADARTTVTDPDLDGGSASPFGWHDVDGLAGADSTNTAGNNVYAYMDTNNDDLPDVNGSPDGGAGLAFSSSLDLSLDPSFYKDAAVTNLFYWNNIVHDILYQYGFDEAAGNFQTNNYGRGGVTYDDAVHAEAQDGSDGAENCNAYFWTPSDSGDDAGTGLGPRPRMQMYTCSLATPDSDGDFDNAVIIHEYSHGISNRLTGGGANVSCLDNEEQMGEGWSDFYGMLLTMKSGQSRTTLRPIANHLFGQGTSGAGLRAAPYQPSPGAPYTTDFSVNSATYGATVTAMPYPTPPGHLSVPHGLGFVWSTILWEVTWDMIDAHGFDEDVYDASGLAGNQIMMNLVTDGLKLQPCSPGFVDGRDAIIAADAALYPTANPLQGQHFATLWSGFARRGLGLSADQGDTNLNSDNVEAFDSPLPASSASVGTSGISIALDAESTGSASFSLSNLAAPGSQDLNWSTSLVFAEIFKAGASESTIQGPAPSGTIEIARTAPALKAPRVRQPRNANARRGGFSSGGPDAFGYRWKNSDWPGPTPPEVDYHYDVPNTGYQVLLEGPYGEEDGYAFVGLPFSFPFYGTSYDEIQISENGTITFALQYGYDYYDNSSIPNASAPNNIVAPLWSDLDMTYGGIFIDIVPGANPWEDDRFVIQYNNAQFIGEDPEIDGTSLNFEVLLSPDGTIEFQYDYLNGRDLDYMTIGIENATGTDGLEVSAFNPYFLNDGYHAIRFDYPDIWATVAPGGGGVAPGASANVEVIFDTGDLQEGTYEADLIVTTNDPLQPSVTIPLIMTRMGSHTITGGAGWRLLAPAASGMTVGDFAAMNLVQGIPGSYPPPAALPNIFTGYDGASFTPAAGTGEVLESGKGFWWYLYDQNLTPGGASNSYALPTPLVSSQPIVNTHTDVALHASGDAFNMLGNPFGVSMYVGGSWVDSQWDGSENLASNIVQMWTSTSPTTGTYETSVTRSWISAWQGFFAEAAAPGTLTLPANGRGWSGVLTRSAPTDPVITFELSEADGLGVDRAAVLTLSENASTGRDRGDASKLESAAAEHVMLAFATADDGGMRAVENRPIEPLSLPMAVASVGASSELVLTWPRVERIPEGWTATIRDLQTGSTVDLLAESEYAFTVTSSAARLSSSMPTGAKAASIPARFELVVGPRAVASEGESHIEFALDAPRPNPVTRQARLGFSLPEAGLVRISVLDVQGREVAVLLDEERTAGSGVATLDATALAAGIYVVRLDSGGDMLTRRIVVAR